jgi:outer membrane protein assembly factor BamB
VLYAGSQYGRTIYAINADTGSVIWQHQVAIAYYSCGGGQQTFSIGETPAIDRGKELIYVADGHNRVHAYNLATGRERAGWPLQIADYQGDHNFMHGGFTYNPANALLYAVTGSTCDIHPWYGRIVAIDTRGPSVAGTFFTMSGGPTQGTSGGGIWGPGGASIDPVTNHVFVATGNADTMNQKQNAGYAEQVIELPAKLGKILANNYPPQIPGSGGDDFDFGATPLLFHPSGCPPLLAAVNKSGIFVLYDRATISNGPIQAIAMSIITDNADFIGVPAFDPVTGYVYVGLPTTEGIYKPGMAAFALRSTCTLNPIPVWSQAFGPDGSANTDEPRSPISIANGVAYISNFTGDTEYAFDALTGAQLWTSPLSDWGSVGTVIANGIAYISAADGSITAWAPPGSAARLRKHVAAANRPPATNSRSRAPRYLLTFRSQDW